MTGLLDVLKEAALDTGLLEAFETSASRVASREALGRRLLLCLYGLGTNAGLKRVAGATPDVSYDELACSPPLHPCAGAEGGVRTGCKRDPGHPQCRRLGRRRRRMRVRFHEVRRVGSQSDDGMACPLRRASCHDLLACRETRNLRLFPAQAVLLFGGRLHDRRCAASLHRYGNPAPICRQPRSKRGRLRGLSAARL